MRRLARRLEQCGHVLGYVPDIAEISALEGLPDGSWKALAEPNVAYKSCRNGQFGVCNWLVPADDETGFCAACRKAISSVILEYTSK